MSTSTDSPAVTWPYSPEADEVRQRVEALIPRMREHSVENEANRGIDADTMAALRDAGVFTMSSPRRWGGLALMPSEQARIVQTVALGDSGVAWNVCIAAVHAQATTRASEQFQEEAFGRGRGPVFAGGGPNASSSARKVEGGWMVKGRWDYASTSQYADWLMGGAIAVGPDGLPYPLGFFVPRDQATLLDNWDVLGVSSSNSQTFEIAEEVFVPEHRAGHAGQILAGPPPALADDEPLYHVHIPVFAQLVSLANAVGTLRKVVDIWQEAALTRVQPHPDFLTQAENPITHLKAGANRAFLAAADAVLDKLGAFADDLAITGREPTEDELTETSALSTYILYQTAEKALDVMRDSSTSVIQRSHPTQRAMRDLIVMNMHAASNRDRSYEALGRHLFGFPPLGFAIRGPKPERPGGDGLAGPSTPFDAPGSTVSPAGAPSRTDLPPERTGDAH